MSETYDGSDELVCVYEASLVESEMVRSLLESNGVEVALHQPGTGGAYTVSVGTMGGGRVMVRAEDREQALEIIAAESETLDADEQADVPDPDEVLAESGRRPWFFWVAVVVAVVMILLVVVEQLQVY